MLRKMTRDDPPLDIGWPAGRKVDEESDISTLIKGLLRRKG